MSRSKISVIVVDDEELTANNIAKNIEAANDSFQVVAIAFDGESALEQIKHHTPDVVFTDIKMPVIGGLEIIKTIANLYPHIISVIVSGYNDFEFVKSALACKTNNYLLKPINFEELQDTLLSIQQELTRNLDDLSDMAGSESMSAKEIATLVKEYISKNYPQSVNLSEIASRFGISLPYLTKIFVKFFGVSPHKYLISHRINNSKTLLRTTEYSIKQIAEMVGYADQFHFSKSFKQEVGETPMEFRKNLTEQ